jgi:ABC-type transport system involved in multi-copper enzyme maturation permease subunit
LTRPLSRPAIYLAKFVAVLPWCFALNLGGFALLCAVGGENGALALRLYWPAVIWATLAFTALFCLVGAYFRRPAVVALVYSFFLEVVLGNMPGYLKRVSIGFYTRCMMFEKAEAYGVAVENPMVYLPVDGSTALAVLVGLTLALLALGMVVFSRTQYHEVV